MPNLRKTNQNGLPLNPLKRIEKDSKLVALIKEFGLGKNTYDQDENGLVYTGGLYLSNSGPFEGNFGPMIRDRNQNWIRRFKVILEFDYLEYTNRLKITQEIEDYRNNFNYFKEEFFELDKEDYTLNFANLSIRLDRISKMKE